jgi:polyphosphate kinase 2 (PPK2 family)
MGDKRNKGDKSNGKEGGKLKSKDYEKELAKLHVELVNLQEWVKQKGLKVCIVFEGRDGAGKGGTIKAITERVSPRVFRVIALPSPSERQKARCTCSATCRISRGRRGGDLDRSWYNRAGVERVMGFCSEDQVKRFLELAPMFEKMMVNPGLFCSSTGWK